MKRMILWAQVQPQKAFWSVVGLHIVLGTLGFFLGLLSGPIDRTTFYIGQLILGMLIIGIYLAHQYFKRRASGPIPDRMFTGFRTRIMLMATATFALFVLNGMDLVSPPFEMAHIQSSGMQPVAARSLDNDPSSQLKRFEQLALSVRNRVKKKFVSPFRELSDPARIILSILFLALAAALIIFLVGLSCALACNEMALLLVVTLIGGLAMVFWLFPLGFLKLWGLSREDKPGWSKLMLLAFLGIPLLIVLTGIAFSGLGVWGGILIVLGVAVGLSFIAQKIRRTQLNLEKSNESQS